MMSTREKDNVYSFYDTFNKLIFISEEKIGQANLYRQKIFRNKTFLQTYNTET